MATRFGIINDTVRTTSGTKDVTSTKGLGGLPADFGMLMSTYATTINTSGAEAQHCVAFTSDTDSEFAYRLCGAEDADTAAQWGATFGSNATDYPHISTLGSDSNPVGQIHYHNDANYYSVNDGMRWNYVLGSRAHYLSGGLFNGDGFSHKLLALDIRNLAKNDTITVDPGFVADAIIVIGHHNQYFYGYQPEETGPSIGFATREDGIKQRCWAAGVDFQTAPSTANTDLRSRLWASDDVGATGDTLSTHSRRVYGGFHSGALETTLECTSFNAGVGSDEIEFTVRGAAVNANHGQFLAVVAIKSTDWIFRVRDFTIPTSGSPDAINAGIDLATDGGFIRVLTHITSAGSDATDNSAWGIAIDMADGTDHVGTTSSIEDNVATSNCNHGHYKGTQGTGTIKVLDGSGTEDIELSNDMSSTGCADTVENSNYPSTATLNFGLFFGPEGGATITGSGTVTAPAHDIGVGTGEVVKTGTGTPTSPAATITGSGTHTALVRSVQTNMVNLSNVAQASLTGLTVLVWETSPPSASEAPDYFLTNQTTDANGDTNWTLTGSTLNNGDPIWVIVMKDGSPPIGTCRKLTVTAV